MGAWIEISLAMSNPSPEEIVAPFMGAWIEIVALDAVISSGVVAPFMGAWIEIVYRLDNFR